MLLPTDTLYPSSTLYPSYNPVISDILKAFRDALVADATLIALVPAANIYAGLRDEKTALPAVDIFRVAGTTEGYAGARVGGMTKVNDVMQVSAFHRNEAGALAIAGRVADLLLGDNTTLNSAGVKNVTMIATPGSMRENNISHIAQRFRYNYHFTIT